MTLSGFIDVTTSGELPMKSQVVVTFSTRLDTRVDGYKDPQRQRASLGKLVLDIV